MEEIMIMVRFDSLWSVWFWIAHVVSWSLLGHFPMAVPYDMVTVANRAGDETSPAAVHCQAMIDAAVWRIVTIFRRIGPLVTGSWFFILSVIGTLGFGFKQELALAVLTILGPMTLVYVFAIHTAFRIDATGARGAEARGLLRRQRLISQIIGLFAIINAAALAVIQVVSRMSTF